MLDKGRQNTDNYLFQECLFPAITSHLTFKLFSTKRMAAMILDGDASLHLTTNMASATHPANNLNKPLSPRYSSAGREKGNGGWEKWTHIL